MLRLRILLALCFALWPSMAVAEAEPSADRAAIARVKNAVGAALAARGDASVSAPAAHRLDLPDRATGENGSDGFPPGAAALHPRLGEGVVSLESVRLPANGVEVVAPLCERLPYHATAPPSRR